MGRCWAASRSSRGRRRAALKRHTGRSLGPGGGSRSEIRRADEVAAGDPPRAVAPLPPIRARVSRWSKVAEHGRGRSRRASKVLALGQIVPVPRAGAQRTLFENDWMRHARRQVPSGRGGGQACVVGRGTPPRHHHIERVRSSRPAGCITAARSPASPPSRRPGTTRGFPRSGRSGAW